MRHFRRCGRETRLGRATEQHRCQVVRDTSVRTSTRKPAERRHLDAFSGGKSHFAERRSLAHADHRQRGCAGRATQRAGTGVVVDSRPTRRTRSATPPALSDAVTAERRSRAQALAAQYRTELLGP